jgi:hypothetical protein
LKEEPQNVLFCDACKCELHTKASIVKKHIEDSGSHKRAVAKRNAAKKQSLTILAHIKATEASGVRLSGDTLSTEAQVIVFNT